ncbi:hypothetical protein MML48_7g00008336 [Holotrichia oblita]|uniref:Uncharacterized protein n=1 Tax=Holotrichia oblita TaxID=644536 RepID=A0ACB9ST80_HOLOL|nr:hypothetical protein MML48_7g00008336 [Holotrichia oblita]
MQECLGEIDEEDVQYDDEGEIGETDELEIQGKYDTGSEQEISDQETMSTTSKQPFLIGKDNITEWQKHAPSKNVRTRSENIISHSHIIRY